MLIGLQWNRPSLELTSMTAASTLSLFGVDAKFVERLVSRQIWPKIYPLNDGDGVQSFPLKVDRWPSGVVQYAAFLESEVESTSELGELGQWLFGKSKFPLVDGVDTELLGLEVRAKLDGSIQRAEHYGCDVCFVHLLCWDSTCS